MSSALTMHGLLKLLQQQGIFVSFSSCLDVNSVFTLLLFILYVKSLEFNKAFPFSFSVPGLARYIVQIGQLVQLYFLCFQGIVDSIFLIYTLTVPLVIRFTFLLF